MRLAVSRWQEPLRALLHAGLPQACTLCAGAAGSTLVCAACVEALPQLGPACPRCALPTPGGRACGACLAVPPAFDRTRAVFRYEFPVDRLVQAFKYHAGLALGGWFAGTMLDAFGTRADADLVVPLPLARPRQRERGYNQALEIARPVARATGLPLEVRLLERVRATAAQAGLPLHERARNLQGAFRCNEAIPGARVLLVDDVMTTGASVDEAAHALKKAGAARIEAWLVARTPAPGTA